MPGPIGKSEHTNEELVSILKGKGCVISSRLEAGLLLIPRDLFVPRDRHREAFRDQKVTVRMSDGSNMTLPPPSFVATAMEKLGLGPGRSFLDVGCGTGYVTALAACLIGDSDNCVVHGIECVSSRLENARTNMRQLKERLSGPLPPCFSVSCYNKLLMYHSFLHGHHFEHMCLCCLMDSFHIPQVLGDPVQALANINLQLSNVLIPECTDGITYDCLYCDASLSEEDLPVFLSLLKPNGKMVVMIEEVGSCFALTVVLVLAVLIMLHFRTCRKHSW